MRKILLLLLAVVFTLPCFAHNHLTFTISDDITASKIGPKETTKVYWIAAGTNEQFLGSRISYNASDPELGVDAGAKKTYYEDGMWNLPEGTEYAVIMRNAYTKVTNTAYKAFNNIAFDRLDWENVRLHATTGSNLAGNVATKGGATVVLDHTPNPHITLKMLFVSTDEKYTATLDFGLTEDNVRVNKEYAPKSISINTPDGKMFPNVGYIKVLFENVKTGKDWVALARNITIPVSLAEKWYAPTLGLDEAQQEARIQAEDFDGPHADGSPAHSNTAPAGGHADGYGYDSRKFDSTCQNIRIHINDESPAGSKGFNLWTPGHGSTDQGLGFALVNFAQQEWNAAYKESVSEASLEDLADYYGAWTEYTVDVQDDLVYADISLRTGVHNANFQAYKSGSAPSPIVAGEGENYMAKYGAAYRIFVDDEPVRSNWSVRPSADIHNIHDFGTWLNNMDESPMSRAAAEPGYFVYAVPDVAYAYGDKANCGNTWSAVYKSEIGDHLYSAGAITDEQKAMFDTPDFANIELSKGQHVIKVQAMGGRTSFDEIKVQAHGNPDTPTGIDLVQQLPGENFDANAPVEWYTLQGVRVENPSNGIFIRRQGSRATKVALK